MQTPDSLNNTVIAEAKIPTSGISNHVLPNQKQPMTRQQKIASIVYIVISLALMIYMPYMSEMESMTGGWFRGLLSMGLFFLLLVVFGVGIVFGLYLFFKRKFSMLTVIILLISVLGLPAVKYLMDNHVLQAPAENLYMRQVEGQFENSIKQ